MDKGGKKGDKGYPGPWCQKSSPWAIMWHCLRDPMFSHFDILSACDRKRDRRTDTR